MGSNFHMDYGDSEEALSTLIEHLYAGNDRGFEALARLARVAQLRFRLLARDRYARVIAVAPPRSGTLLLPRSTGESPMSGLRLVSRSDTVPKRGERLAPERKTPELRLAAFNPGRPRRGHMEKDKSGQGASGTATPFEQHLDLVAREKAVAEREATAAERVEEAMSWAREQHSAVAQREERVALREAEVLRRETEVARREPEKATAPVRGEVEGPGLNAETARPGTRRAGRLEGDDRDTPPRDALSDLAETLYERLLNLEHSIRGSEHGQGPSMKVERNDERWIPGITLFEVHWQAPRETGAERAPERRSTNVRISQERNYLELGSAKVGFIDIEPQAPDPHGTVRFELQGELLECDVVVEKGIRHLLGADYERWVRDGSRR